MKLVNLKGNPKTVNNALDFIHHANSIMHCLGCRITSAHSPVASCTASKHGKEGNANKEGNASNCNNGSNSLPCLLALPSLPCLLALPSLPCLLALPLLTVLTGIALRSYPPSASCLPSSNQTCKGPRAGG